MGHFRRIHAFLLYYRVHGGTGIIAPSGRLRPWPFYSSLSAPIPVPLGHPPSSRVLDAMSSETDLMLGICGGGDTQQTCTHMRPVVGMGEVGHYRCNAAGVPSFAMVLGCCVV